MLLGLWLVFICWFGCGSVGRVCYSVDDLLLLVIVLLLYCVACSGVA